MAKRFRRFSLSVQNIRVFFHTVRLRHVCALFHKWSHKMFSPNSNIYILSCTFRCGNLIATIPTHPADGWAPCKNVHKKNFPKQCGCVCHFPYFICKYSLSVVTHFDSSPSASGFSMCLYIAPTTTNKVCALAKCFVCVVFFTLRWVKWIRHGVFMGKTWWVAVFFLRWLRDWYWVCFCLEWNT